MKSKNLIILLSAVLIFTLAACKPSSPTQTTEPVNKTQPPATTENVADKTTNTQDMNTEPKGSYYLIEEALAKKYGKSVDDFTLGIRKLTLTHFIGIISGMDGIVLAAKQNNEWVIVFDSIFGPEKTYACADVQSYNFPEDMIADCIK